MSCRCRCYDPVFWTNDPSDLPGLLPIDILDGGHRHDAGTHLLADIHWCASGVGQSAQLAPLVGRDFLLPSDQFFPVTAAHGEGQRSLLTCASDRRGLPAYL
ncbi:hypothetical protein ASD81_04445 [Nocardioides sp. Root614]|nr:hypothetical protein ASD81_04445 [Nocardioides sp. Root614]